MLGLGFIRFSKVVMKDRPWDGIRGSQLVLGRAFVWGAVLAFLSSIAVVSFLVNTERTPKVDIAVSIAFAVVCLFLYFFVHLSFDHPVVPRLILAAVGIALVPLLIIVGALSESALGMRVALGIYSAYFLAVAVVALLQAWRIVAARKAS